LSSRQKQWLPQASGLEQAARQVSEFFFLSEFFFFSLWFSFFVDRVFKHPFFRLWRKWTVVGSRPKKDLP
jgi:hypothetical protein